MCTRPAVAPVTVDQKPVWFTNMFCNELKLFECFKDTCIAMIKHSPFKLQYQSTHFEHESWPNFKLTKCLAVNNVTFDTNLSHVSAPGVHDEMQLTVVKWITFS